MKHSDNQTPRHTEHLDSPDTQMKWTSHLDIRQPYLA